MGNQLLYIGERQTMQWTKQYKKNHPEVNSGAPVGYVSCSAIVAPVVLLLSKYLEVRRE